MCCALALMLGAGAQTQAAPYMSVNGANGDYATFHYFINETAQDSETLYVDFYPNDTSVNNVQVWTDLNRRDYATLGAIDLNPPTGTGTTNYWVALPMTDAGGGKYTLSLAVNKCGAYRLTCRYKSGASDWKWYGGRNTAIVVSPKKARDLIMYELMVNTVNATGDDYASRSTFEDLVSAGGRCDLDYLKNLGVNTIWMQPIHPIGSYAGAPQNCESHDPGSPYSIKNLWQASGHLSDGGTTDSSMAAFTNFANAAKTKGVDIFFDVIFNHTAWNCQVGRDPDNPLNWAADPNAQIRNIRPQWYSKFTGAFTCNRNGYNQGDFQYTQTATSASQLGPAPAERIDFGKWPDVADLFWGTYSALYSPTSEEDGMWTFGTDVAKMVDYFAYFTQFWLEKSVNTLGGFRCDYAQGLPPQCWEYLINRARKIKWDFIFMAESLDGGAVSRRAGRHVDIINQNWVWQILERGGNTTGLRGVIDEVKSNYGYAGILRGLVNHDQNAPEDYWYTFSRYAAGACIDGSPQMYQGQELGYRNHYGFSKWRFEYDRWIPNILEYHNMNTLWGAPDNVLKGAYSRLNKARMLSSPIRIQDQYYLNKTDGNPHEQIFSVMKYSNYGWDPADQDVVLCFVNLTPWTSQSGTFRINVPPVYLDPAKSYNAKNLAATDPEALLWGGSGISGTDLANNGVYVNFPQNGNANPDTAFVQILKLVKNNGGGPASNHLAWVGNVTSWPGPTHTNCPGDDCNAELDNWEDLWIDAETWQIAPDQNVVITYSNSANGLTQSDSMDWYYNDANNSHWHANLGKFPKNATVTYKINATDPGTNVWANSGNPYSITVTSNNEPCNTSNNVVSVFNASYSPVPPTSDSNLLIEVHSWPTKPSQSAAAVFCFEGCTNPANWASAEMPWIRNYEYIGTNESNQVYTNINSVWGYNFGQLPTGTTCTWAMVVKNASCGNEVWANNNGSNYTAVIEMADDSDHDGLPDSWETAQFGHLLQGPTNDFDLDHMNNWGEYKSGTSATNPLQYLALETPLVSTSETGAISIRWTGMPQKTYDLEASYDNVSGSYTSITVRSTIGSTPHTITVTDTNAGGKLNGFYRILVP
jgi:hypothetical protein